VTAIKYSLIKSAHNVGEIYVFSARVENVQREIRSALLNGEAIQIPLGDPRSRF
jgi:hypothetical protein